MLHVRETEVALRRLSDGTAQLRASEQGFPTCGTRTVPLVVREGLPRVRE